MYHRLVHLSLPIGLLLMTVLALVFAVVTAPSVGASALCQHQRRTCNAPTPSPTPKASPKATATATPVPPLTPGTYPWHTSIVSTTFWVGEIFNANTNDGSQVCSTYDSQWAYHWGGVNDGTVKASAPDCGGSIYGSCDGASNAADTSCNTETRTAATNYFPVSAKPLENPFYLDLPFDDVNDSTAYSERCQVIPWANATGYAGHCTDQSFSYMKNRWVEITDTTTGKTCYGQNEDAGPGQYHDATYVFGATNARPANKQYNGAGLDVSPALDGCLGFKELDGDSDTVSWRFVDAPPPGPWTILTTTSLIDEQ